MKERLFYFTATIAIIIAGILSRKIHWIPLFTGDALYAIMIYSALRMVFLKPLKLTALIALVVCFAIECSQLIRSEWMLAIRDTTFGRHVLGQGFLWSDLLAYSIGISIALILDSLIQKKHSKTVS